jgi:hypothetical protein
MKNFKTITINGRELQYERCFNSSEWGESTWYNFYEGTTTRTTTYKRFIFFGETITISETKPKHIFTIHSDIESKNLTKTDVRKMIEKQLELLDREEEIKKGNLI